METLGNPQYRDWEEALYVGCLAQMLNEIKVDFKDMECNLPTKL